MFRIYQKLIDQAVLDGVITPEQYLQIPWNERYTMKYLFSPNGRQSIADGFITLEQYLQLPRDERKNVMLSLQDPHTKQAISDEVITPDQYLQMSPDERHSMQYLFLPDGRQAIIDGFITPERYLKIPWNERYTMKYLFSSDGRTQGIFGGPITPEDFLQVRRNIIKTLQRDLDLRQRVLNSIPNPDLQQNIINSLGENSIGIDLVETGKDIKLDGLSSTFQEQIQSSSYKYDGLEDQKKEETLIYTQINLQLDKLENKAKNLCDRDYILAYCKAANIVRLLRSLNHDYFTEKRIDYKTYKETFSDIINQERPELDKHRGYKQILGNLLILIATLGTGQLVNKAYTGNFLFFKTDSAKHINTLSNMLEKMESLVSYNNCPTHVYPSPLTNV
jgi:hypothetical protein